MDLNLLRINNIITEVDSCVLIDLACVVQHDVTESLYKRGFMTELIGKIIIENRAYQL